MHDNDKPPNALGAQKMMKQSVPTTIPVPRKEANHVAEYISEDGST